MSTTSSQRSQTIWQRALKHRKSKKNSSKSPVSTATVSLLQQLDMDPLVGAIEWMDYACGMTQCNDALFATKARRGSTKLPKKKKKSPVKEQREAVDGSSSSCEPKQVASTPAINWCQRHDELLNMLLEEARNSSSGMVSFPDDTTTESTMSSHHDRIMESCQYSSSSNTTTSRKRRRHHRVRLAHKRNTTSSTVGTTGTGSCNSTSHLQRRQFLENNTHSLPPRPPSPLDTSLSSAAPSLDERYSLCPASTPSLQYLHPNVRLQKDKHKGLAIGSHICAKGRTATATKLSSKMQLLSEHDPTVTFQHARLSNVSSSLIETRSILRVQLGFLNMSYGVVLRWEVVTGTVTLVVLRKMCHVESFYPTKSAHERLLLLQSKKCLADDDATEASTVDGDDEPRQGNTHVDGGLYMSVLGVTGVPETCTIVLEHDSRVLGAVPCHKDPASPRRTFRLYDDEGPVSLRVVRDGRVQHRVRVPLPTWKGKKKCVTIPVTDDSWIHLQLSGREHGEDEEEEERDDEEEEVEDRQGTAGWEWLLCGGVC